MIYFLTRYTMEHNTTAKAVVISGDTYTARRELKALGGIWSPDHHGWLVPFAQQEAARQIASANGFDVEECDIDPMLLQRPDGERLRTIRQATLDKKIEKWRARADRFEAQAAACRKTLEPYKDWAFWTEPIKVGHHSEHRHRRLRERLENKIRKAAALASEAQELRETADWAERAGVRVAGDAERARHELRDKLDKAIAVGSEVVDFAFGKGTEMRVNKKSYSIKFSSGSTYARDKTFVRLYGNN